jgi:hypothetical protein
MNSSYFSSTKGTRKLAEVAISNLESKIHRMNLSHLVLPEIKRVINDY